MHRLFMLFGLLAVFALPIQAQSETPTNLQSVYVPMRDDIHIAVDIWLPADTSEPVPTLLNATRYWRGIQNVPDPAPEVAIFNSAGYAVVIMDVRGTGASEGVQTLPWSEAEVADYGEVMDWITQQTWSNGRVGAYGISYAGTAAELTAVSQHPALQAVALQFSFFDLLSNISTPGGVYNELIHLWQAFNAGLDSGDPCTLSDAMQLDCETIQSFTPGVRNVDADPDRSEVNAIIAARTNNVDMAALVARDFRDDMTVDGVSLDSVSPFSNQQAIEDSGVPMLVQVGWMDGANVEAAISRYLTLSNPQQVVIGAWSHGGNFQTDPYSPADAPPDDQYSLIVEFFDQHLKGEPQPMESSITYYTMNAGTWTTTTVWPPEGFDSQRWYFGPDATLTPDVPTAEAGADTYTVDFSATTGEITRWHTPITMGDVIYPDRAAEDAKLLSYTSAPLESDIEITGTPVVTLYVTSTENDGAFHVYLEDVAPDGTVTYITEGMLRAMHRAVDTDPPYNTVGPYHSLSEGDAEPLTPGEVTELQFSLYATSVLIEQGHQIRVSIAGADAGIFQRYPAEGTPTIEVQRNAAYASAIDLPMQAR